MTDTTPQKLDLKIARLKKEVKVQKRIFKLLGIVPSYSDYPNKPPWLSFDITKLEDQKTFIHTLLKKLPPKRNYKHPIWSGSRYQSTESPFTLELRTYESLGCELFFSYESKDFFIRVEIPLSYIEKYITTNYFGVRSPHILYKDLSHISYEGGRRVTYANSVEGQKVIKQMILGTGE